MVEMTKLYFYLDDQRPNPDPNRWTKFTSAQALIDQLTNQIVTRGGDLSDISLSLDHDLGDFSGKAQGHEETGYDVCLFLEQQVCSKNIHHLPFVKIHSSNPVGSQRMKACLKAIDIRLNQ